MERDWDGLTADEWARLDRGERAAIDTNTLAMMALAQRIVDELQGDTEAEPRHATEGRASPRPGRIAQTKVETHAFATDGIDTVEWHGVIDHVPVGFGLPSVDIHAAAAIDALIGLRLDQGPSGPRNQALMLSERVSTLAREASAAFRRVFSPALQERICDGMPSHGIVSLRFDDEGIEANLPFDHLLDIADPVRGIAAAVRFISEIAAAVVEETSPKKSPTG